MSNHETKIHSEEWLGDWRYLWWNKDFLNLMARRWDLSSYESFLDIGCGEGHWTQTLLPFLNKGASVKGLDKEDASIQKARNNAVKIGNSDIIDYSVGNMESIPFANNSFDLVTCQTVLIHTPNVGQILKEVKRVLRPGGRFIAAEPNNITSHLVSSSLNFDETLEEKLERIKFGLICEQGKINLGLGNNSVGDFLIKDLSENEFANIDVYLSDKTNCLIPPYNTQEQKILIQQCKDWNAKEIYYGDYHETKKYFCAGGGEENCFDAAWERLKKNCSKLISHIDSNIYFSTNAHIFYLISGLKPKIE